MSTATRIDELRKKFEENPRRYFAPLANECRKTGDLVQAIALCREHLPKQPGHMSGYIVFGQALYEQGELVEARDVFEQALDLDPENLIALRHLGNIARANGDSAGARRWFERVLEADPRNDDIAAQLATLGTGSTPTSIPAVLTRHETSGENFARAAETPVVPIPSIGFGVAPTPDSVMRAIDADDVNTLLRIQSPIDLDVPDAADMATVGQFRAPVEGLEAFEPTAEVTEAHESVAEQPEELAPDAAVDSGDSFEDGLIAAQWPDTSELVARVLTPRSVTPRSVTPRFITPIDSVSFDDTVGAFGPEAVDYPVVSPDEAVELPWLAVSGSGQSSIGSTQADANNSADAELQAIANAFAEDAYAAGDDDTLMATEEESIPFGQDESFADFTTELFPESPSAIEGRGPLETATPFTLLSNEEEPSEPEAPAFVTETMGELLVSQGLVSRAADVYEELVRRRPYDPVLATRLAELRQMLPPADVPAAPETHEAVPAFSPVIEETFAIDVETTFVSELESPLASELDTVFSSVRERDAEPLANDDAPTIAPTPVYGTPVFAMPRVTPHAALHLTPPLAPYAQPATAEATRSARSARDWFAAIAAHRVARRTPSQSIIAVENSSEGLAALFGNDASAQDDAAARSLADAFAPMSPGELDAGEGLDFDFARATPAFTASVAPPPPSPRITPVMNAGFSFDRFFPDPATQQPTPPPASIVLPDAPVTEDLAQFSSWLKGLGNT